MLPTDLTILILLVSGLTFSIIELGLSAYIISVLDTYSSYNGYGNIVPGWLAFLLFASLWTIVRTLFRLIRLIRRTKRSAYDAGRQPAKWVPILTLVINAVTMIFWLAGFAAYASLLGGFAPTGIYGALLAFAVMLWLIFLSLLIVNILTATGAWKSDNPDYAVLRNGAGIGGGEKGQPTTVGGGPIQQEHPVPVSEVQ